jgi:hypothetical protein
MIVHAQDTAWLQGHLTHSQRPAFRRIELVAEIHGPQQLFALSDILRRRLPLALAIAWLPLPILAATHGGFDDLRALLIDYRVIR